MPRRWLRAARRRNKSDPGTINDRLGNWAFKVSDYVHGELSKSLEDYLEEPPHATDKKHADAG